MKHLVFIHGFASGNYIFQHLIDTLNPHFYITTLSLPGHENAVNLEPDIEVWCKHYLPLIPHNATIIAWSLGSLLAVKIAVKIPVSQLILLATTPQFITTNTWQYGIHYKNFITFKDSLHTDKNKALIKFMALQRIDKHTLATLTTQVLQNLPTTTGVINALTVLYNTSAINEYQILSDKITIFLGKQDYIVPIALHQWLAKHQITTHILDTGHMPFLTTEFPHMLSNVLTPSA